MIFHPSGALGKGFLYKVEDLMLTDKDKLPIAAETNSFAEVIELISDKKLGMAMIVNEEGKLTGVLTDGDIRRTLIKYPNIRPLLAKDVMSANPKYISKFDYGASALNLMENIPSLLLPYWMKTENQSEQFIFMTY